MPTLLAVSTAGPLVEAPAKNLIASLGVTPEPGEKWENGFEYEPDASIEAGTWLTGSFAAPTEPIAKAEVLAFQVYARIHRGLHDVDQRSVSGPRPDYERLDTLAARYLEVGAPKALERELWTGATQPTNPHLTAATATVIGTGAVKPKRALGMLAEALAGVGSGARGVIHAPVAVMTAWLDDGAQIIDSGTRFLTRVREDLVISGSGYTGYGPDGHLAEIPVDGKRWVFATGPCQLRLGPVMVLDVDLTKSADWLHNDQVICAVRTAAISIDPVVPVFAVLVDLDA